MWENALIAIKGAPIFGHGSNGYEEFRHKQVKSKQMAETTLNFGSLHNQYLESWVKRGWIYSINPDYSNSNIFLY